MAAVAEEQEREKQKREEKYQEKDEEKNEEERRPHMRTSALGRSWQLRALPRSAGSRCAPGKLCPSPSREQNQKATRFCSELDGTPLILPSRKVVFWTTRAAARTRSLEVSFPLVT